MSFRIYKLGELGEMSFGLLKLDELGKVSFEIYKLGELGEVSFGINQISQFLAWKLNETFLGDFHPAQINFLVAMRVANHRSPKSIFKLLRRFFGLYFQRN